ncbi:MAG: ATP-binding protein, partial [Planctomycetota bacterium]
LRELANLLQSTLDLDRLIYIILTCATAGHALGFNRAFIFLRDPEGEVLSGIMGVGPSSQEEAFTIWADLASSRKSLADLTADFEEFRSAGESPLTRLVSGLQYHLAERDSEREVLVRTVVEDESQLVRDSWNDARVTPAFRGLFPAREFVSVPLRAKGKVVGVLLADNVYSRGPISSDQLEILELFAAHAGLALDNAQTYEQLKESMGRLREAQDASIQAERLATVGRLAAHVAHEIRNPLVTIGGFARSIGKKSTDASRVRTSAGIIMEEVERLENILSGVMDFSRPAKLEPIVYSVNDLVSRLVPKLEDEMKARGIEIVTELDPEVPKTSFDIAQIHQVLLNLVRNAAEAGEEGAADAERAKTIVIRTLRTEDAVVVEVRDFGPGVPEDLLPSLFEPFITRKVGGTGLGLAVVRKILLDHGGDVKVRSRPGEGATFMIELPLKPVTGGDGGK